MPVGLRVDLTQLNQQAGGILLSLVRDLDQVEQMQTYLAGQGAPGLVALGFTEGDAAVLLSAFSEASQLAQVARGAAALTPARDLLVFARRCTGTSVH